jgi:hypothetical protein
VADDAIEQVVTKTLETKLANATHWSTRGIARASGLSQSTVGRIWRAFGLKPGRARGHERMQPVPLAKGVQHVAQLMRRTLPQFR